MRKIKLTYLTIFFFFAILNNLLAQDFNNINEALTPQQLKELMIDENQEGVVAEEDTSLYQKISSRKEKNFEQEIFGHSYFKFLPTTISPTSDIPASSDYRISIGDSVDVSIFGAISNTLTLIVGSDGFINIKGYGKVFIKGSTATEAEQQINNFLERVAKGTTSELTIKRISPKQIYIVGEVSSPGVYIVNAFTTVSSAIPYGGSLKPNASLREIQIESAGKKQEFDLYDLLLNGDRMKDITVSAGDVILLKKQNRLVEIKGDVLSPMIYEYLPSDTFLDLLLFADPNIKQKKVFITYEEDNMIKTSEPVLDKKIEDTQLLSIEVYKNKPELNKSFRIYGDNFSSGYYPNFEGLQLRDLLSSEAFGLQINSYLYPYFAVYYEQYEKPNQIIHLLNLDYQEKNPEIEIKPNDYLRVFSYDEIEELNLLMELSNDSDSGYEQLTKRIVDVQRGIELIEENQQSNIKSLTLNQDSRRLLNEELLKEYEKLNFELDFLLAEKKEKELLSLSLGKLSRQEIKILERFSIPISIFSSKVYLPAISEVSLSTIKSISEQILGTVSESEYAYLSYGSDLITVSLEGSFDVKSIASISFPSAEKKFVKVSIDGEVNSPGEYIVPFGTTLEDLYNIAGGIKREANQNAIIFTRESIKRLEKEKIETSRQNLIDAILTNLANSYVQGTQVSEQLVELVEFSGSIEPIGRLSGDISYGSTNSVSISLEDGDTVTVPRLSYTINIQGEVNTPITTFYDPDLSLSDYLNDTGGFTRFADKGNVYVIRANGISFKRKYSVFSTNQVELMPGDTIIVPKKYDVLSSIPLVSLAAKTLSDVAFAAASLNAISN
jgi:polysaccharide export outer membrane protein